MMKIRILAFGIAKVIFGNHEVNLEVNEGLNVSGLKKKLEDEYPALIKLKSYLIAIDEEYADEEQLVNGSSEIAIIPPVSGG